MMRRIPEVLASADVRAAINAGQYGVVVRLARCAAGLSQTGLAARAGLSKSAVSRIEAGTGSVNDVTVRARVATALELPASALGILDHGTPAMSTRTPIVAGEVMDVDRRQFNKGVLSAAAMMALPVQLTQNMLHVGADDVAACRVALGRLYELDSTIGSGGIEAINGEMIRRIRYLLATASYAPSTGKGLHGVLAAALEHDGWAAYDADRHDHARRAWLESLHAADIGDHREVRTVAMASMSLQASTLGRGGEAVQLAEAAADRSATPVVRSILAARAGRGHAVVGDKAATKAAFEDARRLLDTGPSEDDPAWTGFWLSGADLASHETRAAIDLGEYARAERLARQAVESSRVSGHGRNSALYSVRYARLLASRREVDGAISILTPVVFRCASISSGRLRTGLRRAARQIGKHDTEPAREFESWTNRVVPA